ncbi:MAG TPA: aspartate/glutamate racemase family protein [Rhabdochlamydiaceae bacterium]
MGSFSKTIGIVGGAGPMASAFLYTTILEICQKQYKANDYDEFPEIVLVSYPFNRGNEETIREEISLCLSKLKTAGADLFCIASHSLHGFLPELPKVGFMNLVTEGIKDAVRQHISRALILAAPMTIHLKLYEISSVQCLYPPSKEQQQVNRLIREIAGGKVEKDQAQELRRMISQIHDHNPFDGIIIACTELPLLHQKMPFSDALPVVNTIEVLAKQLVALARA